MMNVFAAGKPTPQFFHAINFREAFDNTRVLYVDCG